MKISQLIESLQSQQMQLGDLDIFWTNGFSFKDPHVSHSSEKYAEDTHNTYEEVGFPTNVSLLIYSPTSYSYTTKDEQESSDDFEEDDTEDDENDEDEVLMEFAVLWEGWECDSKAWIMQRPDGSRFLRMTNHSCQYTAETEELEDKLVEYQKVIDDTRKALQLLKEGPTTNERK